MLCVRVYQLAARIGASREAVSKCMKQLVSQGAVRQEGEYAYQAAVRKEDRGGYNFVILTLAIFLSSISRTRKRRSWYLICSPTFGSLPKSPKTKPPKV